MLPSNRTIIIEVDLRDNASGATGGLKKTFAEIEARTQRTRNKLIQLGRSQFRVTLSLIDKITPAGSKIQNFLRSMAAKQYLIGVKLTENVFGRIQSLTAKLQSLVGRSYTIGLNLKDNVSKKINGLMEGLMLGAGGAMTGIGTMGAGYSVASALQSYADFEKAMSKVAAIRGLSNGSPEMLALTEQAKRLGMETQFTRSGVAASQFFAALAGYDTQSILKTVPHTLNLAAAGDLSLGRASDVLTDTATAFNLRPGEKYRDKQGNFVDVMEGYTDMLAKIQAISNTNVETAYESLKYSAPVLAAIGRGKSAEYRMQVAEDALIATGLMADSGIKGSQSGTALRAVFSRFSGENRNALFGLRTLGVEVQKNGEMLTPGEIIKNLKSRVDEGIAPEHLMAIAETFAGEKIHADTRRKLDSFIADTLARDGKIGSAGLMKMSSMLAGQESMSGLLAMLSGDWNKKAGEMDNAHGFAAQAAQTMLDNLSGSVTKLESAFDSLRQGFFEGNAGAGLRGFVDTLTELTTRANKLFADGIGFADIFKLTGDVIDRLKNKFLELNGIGSALAGGALMAAFVKIGRTVQKVIGYIGQLKGLQIGQMLGGATGAKGGTVSAAASVGTMNVTAGVVNIAGKAGGVGGAAGGRRVGNTAIIDNYNATKERIRGTGAPPPPSMRSTFASGAKGGAAFAAMFGAMELFSAKSLSAERAKEAADALNLARSEYQELVRLNRPAEELTQHAEKIQGLETDQKRILQENKSAERDALAGVTGSVLGAAVGAGLGSIAGPLGTTIGGVIGGVIGDYLGHKATEIDTSSKPKFGEFAATNLNEVREESKMIAGFHARRATGGRATAEATQSRIVATQDRARMVQEKSPMLNLYNQTLQKHINDLQYGTGAQGATQDYYRRQSEMLLSQIPAQVLANQQKGWDLLRDMFGFGGTAHAATLSEEQLLQQAQMERPLTGDTVSERVLAGLNQPATELSQPESTPLDFSSITEQLYSDMESFTEGINELFSGIGESISETLTTSFEGVGETFSGFTDSITENLTSAFEGINEYFSEIGAMFSENLAASFESVGETFNSLGSLMNEALTNSFESAGEMFTAFGESLTSTLTTAQASAETSLLAIGTAFETTKSTVQSSWAEIPGFFEGIFSGLGGAASSAGAAIHAGLTAPIGSIIGAWQSAASQISSIISSISAQAAAMPSISNVGGGRAFAEGGFVTSPTQSLIGEAGAEVVIPLSSSKRSRALDLFDKTAMILGGEAAIPRGDFVSDIPALANTFSGYSIEAPTNIPTANQSSMTPKIEINLGGINGTTFSISGANNPQEFMKSVADNLSALADKVAGHLGKTVLDSFNNMSLGH